jgi:hypothetical protein
MNLLILLVDRAIIVRSKCSVLQSRALDRLRRSGFNPFIYILPLNCYLKIRRYEVVRHVSRGVQVVGLVGGVPQEGGCW